MISLFDKVLKYVTRRKFEKLLSTSIRLGQTYLTRDGSCVEVTTLDMKQRKYRCGVIGTKEYFWVDREGSVTLGEFNHPKDLRIEIWTSKK